MNKIKFKATGFAFDERNRRDYNAVTRRIEKALIDIETNLSSFKSKPTQKYLARKSGCSVETLIYRSRINRESRQTSSINPVKNNNGHEHNKSNQESHGWPLSEITRLQQIFKSIQKKKQDHNSLIKCEPDKISQNKQTSAISQPENINRLLSNLRGQNAQLFMENEDLKIKLANATSSLSRVENTCTALKEENSSLYNKIMELKNELKKQTKANFTLVTK